MHAGNYLNLFSFNVINTANYTFTTLHYIGDMNFVKANKIVNFY